MLLYHGSHSVRDILALLFGNRPQLLDFPTFEKTSTKFVHSCVRLKEGDKLLETIKESEAFPRSLKISKSLKTLKILENPYIPLESF